MQKPAAGFPRGWSIILEQIYRVGEPPSMVSAGRGEQKRSSSDMLHTDATGHKCTSGEGVILSYASDKSLNQTPR